MPRPFVAYAAATLAVAVAVAAVAGAGAGFTLPGESTAWLMAALVLLGELLPIHVPRRTTHDWITVSSPFAVGLLLAYGAWPAIVALVVASVIADTTYRTSPVMVIFNAAQYVVAIGAAAAVLTLMGHGAPVGSIVAAGPSVLVGAAAFFVVNEVVAGTGIALRVGQAPVAYLLRDAVFHAWTGGFQLALAPIVVIAANAGGWLLALSFCPLLAIFLGGRQAALNAHAAEHDPLTDLPNLNALRSRIADAEDPVSVLVIALDDLGTIRETLGHATADRLLGQVAERLRAGLQERDVLARMGGEGELALVPAGDPVIAVGSIFALLVAPFDVQGLLLEIHATVGVADGPPDPDTVLRHAGVALAAAREAGRPWSRHTAEQDERSEDRLALATQLRRALDRDELTVHYQLKVPLRRDQPTYGVEALVRWQHPQLGLVAPDGFISLAERTGLIAPLTERVLARALADLRGWLDEGLDAQVAVNVAPPLLLDDQLPATVERLLARAGIDPDRLQLEITESRLLADDGRAVEVIRRLRELGVTLAIDDFGVGFSSLGQLRRLPVAELKIDKSFVSGMEEGDGGAAVVRAAAALGRDLGIAVVAEGVETPAECQRVRELGCDYAQGFLFGRPAPAAELAARLRSLQAPAGEGARVVALGGAV